MNKVFKVIWSEARNAYVVVSEIAKNHGSKSCSTKKLLTMLIATGVMTCASMAPAMAADPPAEALKHSTVTNGYNITVTEGLKDGGKEYNVALNNDIYLAGDDPDALVSISGSKGTIWATGSVTVGSGVDSSVVMDGTTATVSGLSNKTTAYAGFANGKGKAATEEQLKEISEVAENANQGWNLSTNGGEASKVAPGETVDFSGDQNINISNDGTNVKVELKNDIYLAGDDPNAFVSISGSKGTIWATGSVAAGNVVMDGHTETVSGLSNKTTAYAGFANGEGKAATEEQLKEISEVAENANQGWNLSTNGGEASKVAPGETVDFSGDKNINISNDGTNVKVKLNDDIDVKSVQTNVLNAKYNLSVGTANENGTVPFFVNSNGAFYAANGKLVVDKDGKVTAPEAEFDKLTAKEGVIGNVVLKDGVFYKNIALRDGELYVGDADGNYSQITPKSAKLGQVTIDEKGNIAGVNSVQTNALNAKYNLSVGTANENGTVPFFVNSNGSFYAANGKLVVDKDGKLVAPEAELGKVTADEGEIGNVVLKDGVFYKHTALRDGELFVGDADGNYSQITTKGAKLGKVTVAADGKISGVAAGAVTADSTDAVNGSQLHAVATEAGKHSKVVNGSNVNVEETDVDGQKFYKVNLNKDIMLGDLTGKYVNISGTNGTIETTGYIATKDRVYADKGAKLADIDVTGNKISNGASSIVLDGSNVKVNDKVTIDQNGKISGVARGEADTDAVNYGQLKETNDRVTANAEAIEANKTAIEANKNAIETNKNAISDLNTRVDSVAKQHTTVKAGDKNITVIEGTNKDGGKEYTVALDKNINVDKVTAGDTTISDKGLEIKDGPSVTKDGINAGNKKVTNVAAGELSETSKDVVNGSQLYKTNQEVANNTNRINQLGSRVNKVGAGAAALAALHPMDFDPDDKLTFSAGYGNYGGENAAAIGAYYRPDEKVMFSVGGTVGNGENMVNAGVSFSLDRTNHVSNSRTAMAREILDLRAEVTELKAMVAKGGLGSIAEDKMKIFPDVAENHWAYEYVGKLAAAGIIEGYPDGKFSGDRMMSRYEFAAMLYRAMQKGAQLDSKIINEFAPEMGRIRVDRISGEDGDRDKIERVRVNAVKGERDHYGNKIAKAEAKAK